MPGPDPRRRLPSVDRLLRSVPEAAACAPSVATALARQVLKELRGALPPNPQEAARTRLEALIGALRTPRPQRVLNLTGILLHTNLGRAPLGPKAAHELAERMSGWCDLEIRLADGARAHREEPLRPLWDLLFPGYEVIAVNNNAAALALAVATAADGAPVAVSRGELPEIGGSFRIGSLLESVGVRLLEVGSTNRTRTADFKAAVRKGARVVLRVHPANFRIEGHACAPDVRELCAAVQAPVIYDAGSGLLSCLESGCAWDLPLEQPVAGALAAGCAVVTFSADKLPGGPQAGIAVGHRTLIRRMRRHPLYRALRVDKHTIALLDLALRAWLGLAEPALVSTLMGRTDQELARLARSVSRAARNAGLTAEPLPGVSEPGGGTCPGQGRNVREVAVGFRGWSAARLAARLRSLPLPVVGRIAGNRVRLNPATLLPGEERLLASTLSRLADSGNQDDA